MKMKPLRCIALLTALALTACPTTNPKKDAKKPATTSNHAPSENENDSVDFQAFLGRLREAVRAHDVNAVAAMMTVDFGYHLSPDMSGPGVFKYWDDNGLWVELNGILGERFVPNGAYMVAPPQFADPSAEYQGYRAGIRRVNGSWKFAYFVNG
ncbi:MAG TPA: hypothetical protein VGI85_00345 [Chthoniobacterales bacterium]